MDFNVSINQGIDRTRPLCKPSAPLEVMLVTKVTGREYWTSCLIARGYPGYRCHRCTDLRPVAARTDPSDGADPVL